MSNQEFKQQVFQKRVLFVGIPDMAYICLDGLKLSGVNLVGVVGPKKDHQTFHHFKNFVIERNLNYIDYENLTDENFINSIKELNADIAIVCSFNYKIPKVLLECIPGGFINVHPSLLPHYRGANPYSAVIMNGEKETGVTLHFMDEDFDTGDMIFQQKIEITPSETMGTLFNRTNVLAFNMLLEVLKRFETDELPRFKQPEGDFVKCELSGKDTLLINYKQSARQIESFVRALNPFIIASTLFRQTLTKVYTGEYIEKEHNSEPGTIVHVDSERVYVATSQGLFCPMVLQFGSFFVGSSKDFIKILNPKVGEKFNG